MRTCANSHVRGETRAKALIDLAALEGFGIFIDPSPTAVVGTPPLRGIQDLIERSESACSFDARTRTAHMSQFQTQTPTAQFRPKEGVEGRLFVDYRSVEDLRRLMTPNGKIYSRKRTGLSAQQQAQVAQAIKRARFMALLPYTSATM
jgi:small subunit ribosomal protein S18